MNLFCANVATHVRIRARGSYQVWLTVGVGSQLQVFPVGAARPHKMLGLGIVHDQATTTLGPGGPWVESNLKPCTPKIPTALLRSPTAMAR